MRFSVSTVKDNLENVEFFVQANLASGIDHMFVILDSPGQEGQPEVAEMLRAHPHVTLARCNRSWWVTGRPARLNVRQRINANWVRELLAPFPWAEWLFHIDGDEVVRLDDDALAAVPATTNTVSLQTLEAVSEMEPEQRRPLRFKRQLDAEELNLLHVLGMLTEPSNQHYFHGHLLGKVGVRPSAPVAFALHNSIPTSRTKVVTHRDDRLQLLHYDAVSGAEFVRKWEALSTAGAPRFRANRMPVARALAHVVTSDIAPDVRHAYLRRLYEISTADDVSALSELGLLVDVDPALAPRAPAEFPAGAREALNARFKVLRGAEKKHLYVPDTAEHRASRTKFRARQSLRQARRAEEREAQAVEEVLD